MKKYGNEFKVGLFVILCVLGLIYLTFSTGKVSLGKKGYHIYVVFNDIAGIELKAPVMLNGLEVGKVDDIKFSYDANKTEIKLKLWIDDKAKIRDNAAVSIKTLGLMGEKFIQISSVSGGNFLAPEAILEGKPYLDLDALLEQAQTMTKNLSDEFNKLLVSINGTVDGNKETVSQIVKNFEATSKNFEEFSADIKKHPWKLLIKGKDKD